MGRNVWASLRPSPGTVIACIALIVSASGVAWAAATIGPREIEKNAVRSKHVKKDAITGAHVADGSLASGDFGPNELPAGPAGRAGPQGPPGAAATALWAVVNPDGSSPASSGLISSVRSGAQYNLRFNRDVSRCAAIATLGGSPTYNSGTVGEITAHPAINGLSDTVAVIGKDSDGTNEGGKPFHLAVFC